MSPSSCSLYLKFHSLIRIALASKLAPQVTAQMCASTSLYLLFSSVILKSYY